MISFSLTELGLPSLQAVLEMTWAEYLIRVDGFLRQREEQQLRDRRSWYYTLIAPNADPTALPKTEQAFMPLEHDKRLRKQMNQALLDKLAKRAAEYQRKKEANHGGTQAGNRDRGGQ